MKSLANPGDVSELLARLKTLRPDSRRLWGRMTPHQAVCHMTDAFLMGTPRKPVSMAPGFHNRTIIKWIALYAPIHWPAGIETRPEVDQLVGGGTAPVRFDADVTTLAATIAAAASEGFFRGRPHPIFGSLSDRAWLRWGYLHVDHHLRQFGA